MKKLFKNLVTLGFSAAVSVTAFAATPTFVEIQSVGTIDLRQNKNVTTNEYEALELRKFRIDTANSTVSTQDGQTVVTAPVQANLYYSVRGSTGLRIRISNGTKIYSGSMKLTLSGETIIKVELVNSVDSQKIEVLSGLFSGFDADKIIPSLDAAIEERINSKTEALQEIKDALGLKMQVESTLVTP